MAGDEDEERSTAAQYPRPRQPASVLEAKALAHPLRLRILRLCAGRELTNKQLADELGSDPGTVHFHVRLLVRAHLLEQTAVRTGASGALEKPYTSTGRTWWLTNPIAETGPAAAMAPIEAFRDEVEEAGPDSVATFARFVLHLSDDDVTRLDERIIAILDEYVETDHERRHLPAHGGIVVLHRLAPIPEEGPPG